MSKAVEYIRDQLPPGELFAQLAEEAGELAHVALKLRRIYEGKNPTPMDLGDAFDNLEEEIADVLVCLEVLGYTLESIPKYRAMMDAKQDRWQTRLEKAKTSEKPDIMTDFLSYILRKYDITPKELETDDDEKGRAGAAAPRG